MTRFLDILYSGQVLLMDGAMGTELQRAGVPEGACYEAWNLTHPEQVRAIHRAYVHAGARCLLTNTFQSNPAALARHGRADDLEAINRAAIDLARSVCSEKHFVLASLGPMDGEGEDFARVVRALAAADALLLETWSAPCAAAAAERARQHTAALDLPVLLSFTFRFVPVPHGPMLAEGGLVPERVAEIAQQAGVAALGVNCGRDIGMDEVIDVIRRYRQATDVPLFARPNAGTPSRSKQGWVYPHTAAEMAKRLPELLEAGVAMIGGCCGTTPAYIAAFRPVIDEWNARRATPGKV